MLTFIAAALVAATPAQPGASSLAHSFGQVQRAPRAGQPTRELVDTDDRRVGGWYAVPIALICLSVTTGIGAAIVWPFAKALSGASDLLFNRDHPFNDGPFIATLATAGIGLAMSIGLLIGMVVYDSNLKQVVAAVDRVTRGTSMPDRPAAMPKLSMVPGPQLAVTLARF